MASMRISAANDLSGQCFTSHASSACRLATSQYVTVADSTHWPPARGPSAKPPTLEDLYGIPAHKVHNVRAVRQVMVVTIKVNFIDRALAITV